MQGQSYEYNIYYPYAEVRIYNRRQESKRKTERKHALERERNQERKVFFSVFLDRLLGRERVFFIFFLFSWSISWSSFCFLVFLISCFLLKIPTSVQCYAFYCFWGNSFIEFVATLVMGAAHFLYHDMTCSTIGSTRPFMMVWKALHTMMIQVVHLILKYNYAPVPVSVCVCFISLSVSVFVRNCWTARWWQISRSNIWQSTEK